MLRTISAAALALLLTSCTTTTNTGAGGDAQTATTSKPKVDASAPLATSAADLAKLEEEEDESKSEPTLYRGNDRQVKMPPVEEPVRFVGEDVSINFEAAPLSEVMHAILGDILKLDYVVDQPVTGEVTVRTRTPIPRN